MNEEQSIFRYDAQSIDQTLGQTLGKDITVRVAGRYNNRNGRGIATRAQPKRRNAQNNREPVSLSTSVNQNEANRGQEAVTIGNMQFAPMKQPRLSPQSHEDDPEPILPHSTTANVQNASRSPSPIILEQTPAPQLINHTQFHRNLTQLRNPIHYIRADQLNPQLPAKPNYSRKAPSPIVPGRVNTTSVPSGMEMMRMQNIRSEVSGSVPMFPLPITQQNAQQLVPFPAELSMQTQKTNVIETLNSKIGQTHCTQNTISWGQPNPAFGSKPPENPPANWNHRIEQTAYGPIFKEYGAELILPNNNTVNYRKWDCNDFYEWICKILITPEQQIDCQRLRHEEWDGSLLVNIMDHTTNIQMQLKHGAFLKVQNHAAVVINEFNKCYRR